MGGRGEGGSKQLGEEWRGLQETLVCRGRGLEDLCQGKKAGISGWTRSLGGEVGGSDDEFIVCPTEGDEWLGETIVCMGRFGQCLGVTSACMNAEGHGECVRG